MARARNIKPAFFMNEILAELSFESRLLFIGLWTLSDREGRLEDKPKRIRIHLFPMDEINVDSCLQVLADSGFIIRYCIESNKYIQILNFTKHQMPHHKEVASVIPAPSGFQQITKHTYDVSSETRSSVFVRDGMKCLKCGTNEGLSLDHIIPLGLGGDNEINNLQTLCKSCNSSKGKTTKDYRQTIIDPTLKQQRINESDCFPPDYLNPECGILNPDLLNPEIKEHVNEDVHATVSKPEKYKDEIQFIFEHWKKVMNKRGTVILDSKRKSAIRARLVDGYTQDMLCKAVDGCSMTDHNMGRTATNKTLYNDIEFICRNAPNVDRFMDTAGQENDGTDQGHEDVVQVDIADLPRPKPAVEPSKVATREETIAAIQAARDAMK